MKIGVFPFILGIAAVVQFGGCSDEASTLGVNGLVEVLEEPAGSNCVNGGLRINAGQDSNANGTLDEGEVSETQYVCHGGTGQRGQAGQDGEDGEDGDNGNSGETGDSGSDGLESLVSVSEEAAGDNCAEGGQEVRVGLDEDGDDELDEDEVSATYYVCNGQEGEDGEDGETGETGETGADGIQTLVAIADQEGDEPCPYGGQRVTVGPDTNGNDVLDDDEVASTEYLCDGSSGTDGLNALVEVSDDDEFCPEGGTKVEVGLDENENEELDEDELATTQYVCHGEGGEDGGAGENGLNALIDVSDDDDGECTDGGTKVEVGLDENENNELDEDEVTSTEYICNPEGSSSGGGGTLVDISTLYPGVLCPSGGKTISYGHDDNENMALDIEEVDGLANICSASCGDYICGGGCGTCSDHADGCFEGMCSCGENDACTGFDACMGGECSPWQEAVVTNGPISSIQFSNSQVTEDTGQTYLYSATGVRSSIAATTIRVEFGEGTVSWESFNATKDYHGNPTVENPDDPTGSGVLTSGEGAPIELERGDNVIELTHEYDGSEQVYTIKFRRGGQLEGLDFSPAETVMTPDFDPGVYEYYLSDVPYGQSKAEFFIYDTFNNDLHIECSQCDWWLFEIRNTSPWREHWGAMAVSLTTGDNRATFYYNTGIDGQPREEYYVNVRRLPAFGETTFSEVTLSNTEYEERSGTVGIFDADGVAGDVESTDLTALFSNGTATWESFNVTKDYDNQFRAENPETPTGSGNLTSGEAATIPLVRGDNAIVLTLERDGTETVYTFNLRRAGQLERLEFVNFIDNDNIETIPLYNSDSEEVSFDPTVFEYYLADVPYETTSVEFQVEDTFNNAGNLQSSLSDWWLFETRNVIKRGNWGPMAMSLNTGDNRDAFSYNPGVSGIDSVIYYVNVHRLSAFSETGFSEVTFSNADFTERSGTLGIFDVDGVAGDVQTTDITAVFTAGTVTWESFNVTKDYDNQFRAENPETPTGSGSLTSGVAATVPLVRGDNAIVLTLDRDGTETVYTFNMRRAGQLERLEFVNFIDNDNIETIPLYNADSEEITFSPTVLEYWLADVPYDTTSVEFQVEDTFNDDGHLQSTLSDWWLFETRNVVKRDNWGPMTIRLDPGANRDAFTYNPGVSGIDPVIYYVNVHRGE